MSEMRQVGGGPSLPTGRNLNRRRTLWYGLGGVAVIGIYVWWTRSQSTAATDTTGTLDQFGNPIDMTGPTGTTAGDNTTTQQGPILPVNNQQWFQMSVTYLTSLGYNGAAVGLALGRYLSHLSLSAQQAHYVETAIGAYGPPPTNPGGPVIIHPPTGWAGTHFQPHIRWAALGPKRAQLVWTPIPGATSYHLFHGANLAHVAKGTFFQVNRHSGRYHVIAYHDNQHSKTSNIVTVK